MTDPTAASVPDIQAADPTTVNGGHPEIRSYLLKRGNSVWADGTFRSLMILCAISIFFIVALIAFELIVRSQLTISKFGLSFFF